ncbi:MAG: MurR/RpiR family transcriptional regulator, partial [Acholeplasmataceae bacterium]|nr:MurR/RpiR family transcriptional regulator [Acholeplasmataceae bacterium]
MRNVKDLSPSERHVVDYIFDNLQEVSNIGIVELSQKTFTSTSTIKRLCAKLGIDSYIDFRLQISIDLKAYLKESIIKEANIPVKKHDSIEEIIKKVSYFNAKSIIDSKDINDKEDFTNVVKLMTKAKRMDFFGVGPSNLVAKDAALKCLRLGIDSSAYENKLEMFIKAKSSSEESIAFLISYTGETGDIIEVAQELALRKVPTVSLTGLSDNTLIKHCTYNLFVDASEPADRLGAMYSRTSTLNVVDILFTAFINTNYEAYMSKAHQTYMPKK